MTFHECVCGNRVILFNNHNGTWKVVCEHCELRTADHETIEDARVAWNKCFEKELPIEYITVPNPRMYGIKNRYKHAIKPGDRFKSFKDLSLTLGERWPKHEPTQKKHKRIWSQFFAWEIDNHSFHGKVVITEVFEQPKLIGRVHAPARSPIANEIAKARKAGLEKEYARYYAKMRSKTPCNTRFKDFLANREKYPEKNT